MGWILVILLTSGTEGGAAIDSHLQFSTQAECQVAAKSIYDSRAVTNSLGWPFSARVALSCVKVG